MTDRVLLAYVIMALLVACAGATVLWNVHHSQRRIYQRVRKKYQQRVRIEIAARDLK